MKKLDKNINKPIQLQVALVPVCKMVMRFGLHFNEFVRNMQKAYIYAAKEILEEKAIKPNAQAIAIKTGMDRRTISEHINATNYTNPMNKMDMVIVQLQLYCSKNHVKKLSKVQLQSLIDSIYGGHIRANAIIRELLSNRILKKLKNNYFKLNLTLQQQLVNIGMMAQDVDYTAKRLFQTFYKNMFFQDGEANLLQKTSVSTKIPPRFHAQVNQLIQEELLQSEEKINAILAKYERNITENTYPEIGLTQFQFNSRY